MIKSDFHIHTTYCDGKNTPEEMVLSALSLHMSEMGFSGHAHVTIDDCCMTAEGTDLYKAEIKRLQALYGDRIRILCGIEQDYYSDLAPDGYDYVIGSVHYLPAGEGAAALDDTEEKLLSLVRDYYGGDLMRAAEQYFDMVAQLPDRFPCTIIGHFDLITKYNEGNRLFDTSDPRYVAAWKKAADALLKKPVLFEINTGAISRGYRTKPYPSEEIIDYLAERGAKFILSSDSHRADTLLYGFAQAEELAGEINNSPDLRNKAGYLTNLKV